MGMKLLNKLVNSNGQTYFVKVRCADQQQASRFLQEMWRRVDGSMVPTEAQATEEWTDRKIGVRSTWSRYDGACIRTHAWSPRNDDRELPDVILSYLRENGIDV